VARDLRNAIAKENVFQQCVAARKIMFCVIQNEMIVYLVQINKLLNLLFK